VRSKKSRAPRTARAPTAQPGAQTQADKRGEENGSPTRRKDHAPARAPRSTRDHTPPLHAGGTNSPGPAQTTKTRRPNPAAKANVPQVPDPPPDTQRRAGTTPRGQAETGNPTTGARSDDAATARTIRTERRTR
jgi:hypothetical protein